MEEDTCCILGCIKVVRHVFLKALKADGEMTS